VWLCILGKENYVWNIYRRLAIKTQGNKQSAVDTLEVLQIARNIALSPSRNKKRWTLPVEMKMLM
jgi:hypothetical protein